VETAGRRLDCWIAVTRGRSPGGGQREDGYFFGLLSL